MSVNDIFVIPEDESIRTFENDEKLPNLPLPKLSDTLQRYLESVKPFVNNDNEYEKTKKLVKYFENGIGQILHSKLVEKTKKEKNWLEKWWEDYAYLSLREPLIPFYSMTGSRELLPANYYTTGQQLKFASLECYHYVLLWDLLRKERLKPAKTSDNRPFSMAQFKRLFNSVRVPGEHKDSIQTYFKTEKEGYCPSNIIVLKNNFIFSINGLHKDGKPLTPTEWKRQLETIQNLTNCRKKESSISYLSCDFRKSWAKNREHLLKIGNENKICLIESAMFVLCLDDAMPQSNSEALHFSLTGDYSCRWPDKSMNIIIYKNGIPGGICDHSAFDGIVSMLATFFVDFALREDIDYWESNTDIREDLEEPIEIEFTVDEYIMDEMKRVPPLLDSIKNQFMIEKEEFKDFGKEAIQSLKIHPDTFVQMAIQLSYYKLHSRPAPCYETASTRMFYNGRTETVRTCTTEVVTWIRAMLDSSVNDKQKTKLLLEAIKKHNELMELAKRNEGCDRHLFGLACAAFEEGIDSHHMFKDPLYTKSGGGGNFILSTSLSGYLPIIGGVAPMCDDGYGVFYSICPKSIFVTISISRKSFETSTIKFYHTLFESLNNIRCLLESHSNPKL
uniref:Choline/carnitine acyltransferase domain-containing protein n=2 Tax=Clastoptera arizonana TaxID=38151 RepID=A0A1B6D2K7_9HEMI